MHGGHVHTGDVIVQGIRSLLPDYAGRIGNFLVAYLGIGARPVPFGGRTDALGELDRWLADPTGSPYRLLAAPPGRGKSALVIRWVKELIESQADSLDVVFVPVSIRFRTNLEGVVFQTLATHLARLRGESEELRSTIGASAEQWRGLIGQYLRSLPAGRRLLIVLDGIDEAADWELGPDLFPLDPHPGLRVLVSARLTARSPTPERWLEQLGWHRFGLASAQELGGLDLAGVREAVLSMGAPLDTLADEAAVVAELFRLTGGDPLLIGLYVDELWGRGAAAARLRPEELSAVPAGLEGFLRWWWEDQAKLWGADAPILRPAVRTVLNLLAGAFGPLRKTDLVRLAPPGASIDARTLEHALIPLQRFVIGDGREHGFAFSHPRLGWFFWESDSREGLPPEEQEYWEERFLAYGREVLLEMEEHRIAPAEASPYVVQYYGAHLTRSSAGLDRWSPLLCESWWRAWLATEGGYSGFFTDVDRIMAAARAETRRCLAGRRPALHLHLEAACTLCHSRISAIAGNLPPPLIAALVEKRIWTVAQALAFIRRVRDPMRQAEAAILMLRSQPAQGADDILHQALEAARRIEDGAERAPIIATLAPMLRDPEDQAGVLEEALAALESTTQRGSDSLLAHLARRLPEPLLSRLVSAQSARLREWSLSDGLLLALARRAPSSCEGFLSPDQRQQLHRLRAVLDALQGTTRPGPPPRDEFARALHLLLQSFRGSLVPAGTTSVPPVQLASIARFLGIMEDDGDSEGAPAILSHLQQVSADAYGAVWKTVVPRLSDAALEKLASEKRLDRLSRVLVQLERASRCPAPEQSERTEEVLRKLAASYSVTVEALVPLLAPHLPEDVAVRLLHLLVARPSGVSFGAAAALARYVPEHERTELLSKGIHPTQVAAGIAHMAPLLTDELLAEAFRLASGMTFDWQAEHIRKTLVPYLPPPLLGELLAESETIGDASERTLSLAAIASALEEPAREEFENTALAWAEAIVDPRTRARVLERMVPNVGTARLPRLIACARAITQEPHAARVLGALAAHAPESLLDPILAAADALEDERYRAHVLLALAPAVSPGAAPRVITAVRRMSNDTHRTRVLGRLAPHLHPDEHVQLLANSRGISNEWHRVQLLADLAPHLDTREFRRVVVEARHTANQIVDPRHRARVLSALAGCRAPTGRDELLAEAIAAASAVNGPQLEVWSELAPSLPPHLLRAAADKCAGPDSRFVEDGRIAAVLTSYLPPGSDRDEFLARELARLGEIDEPRGFAPWRDQLVPHLPMSVLETAVLTAPRAWPESSRAVEAFRTAVETMPPDRAYMLWSDLLEDAGPSLHRAAHRLAILARVLAGPTAVEGMARALVRSVGWWQ